eukprot:2169040-Rhodomonas_salina.1
MVRWRRQRGRAAALRSSSCVWMREFIEQSKRRLGRGPTPVPATVQTHVGARLSGSELLFVLGDARSAGTRACNVRTIHCAVGVLAHMHLRCQPGHCVAGACDGRVQQSKRGGGIGQYGHDAGHGVGRA